MITASDVEKTLESPNRANAQIPNENSPVFDKETLDPGRDLETSSHGSRISAELEAAQDEEDPNVVGWDGLDDPKNPRNWPRRRRLGHVAIVTVMTFVTPLASTMFAPGINQVMDEFNSTNSELASFVVSVFVLGFAFGPLVLAPLSEMYGRLPVYHACNIIFVAFTIGCAESTSLSMLIIFRFFAGLGGSGALTLGGGTIADCISPESRGAALSLFSLGPTFGPVVGPAAGGFLAQNEGWRWVFRVLSIVGGLMSISTAVFMRETYPVVLLERKAKKLRKETGNTNLRSKYDNGMTGFELFRNSIVRPTRMLLFSPIVFSIATFIALIYGYLYLLFTTFPLVFEEQYHWSPGISGLAYIGLGLGNITALGIYGIMSDKMMKKRMQTHGKMRPEDRLPLMMLGSPLIVVGFFWYGWSADAHTHWIVPILGTVLIGIGMVACFMPGMTYVVDAYELYAASGLAALAVVRSIVGAVLPLAGRSMFRALGIGWGNSLLAFIALVGIPIPWLFYHKGEYLRARYAIRNL